MFSEKRIMIKKGIPANLMKAGDIFVPGKYIIEELNAKEMKQIDLANKLGLSKSQMSLILNGKRSITVPLAIKLEQIFKKDAEFWMRLQINYEIEILKKEKKPKKDLL